ncbi:hypothetical protein QBZ16_004815 [Prototheca wickerhamii]|uniref:Uncharacterized protein n=1 Tax=Prototheca wickerhamii TaxID=3111 RepID=A0AAD9IF16_PROWI|nr:hypothetical protein QBZ16_004815 [Prototheca wickerhamii]
MSLRLSAACGPVLVESLRASSGFARVLEEDTAPQEVHAACCADLVESVAIEGGEALIVGVAGRDRAAHSLLGLTGVPSRAPEAGAVIRAAVQLLVAGAQEDEAIEDVQGPHEGRAAANAEAAASVSDIVVGHDERPHSRARPAHAPAELSLRAVALEAQEGGETRFVDLLAGGEGEPGSASASDVSCSPTTPETATWAPVPSVPALLAALSRSTMPYLASRRGGAEPDAVTLVTLRALRGEGAAACASTLHFAACVAGPEASSAGSPALQLRAALSAASAANAVLAEAVRAWADRPEGSLLDILVSDRVFGALESYRASVRGAPAGGQPLARGGPGAPALRSSDILGALERTVASSDGDWMLRSHRPGEASQREASARPLPTLREHWADFASGAARALGAKRAHLAGDAAHPAPPEVDVSGAEDGAERDPGHVTPPSAEDAKTKSSWRVKSKMAIKRMMHSMKPRSAQGSWARI